MLSIAIPVKSGRKLVFRLAGILHRVFSRRKMSQEKITVPPELENMLLDYTIKAIVENPEDLVSHAAEYFARLRDERDAKINSKPKQRIMVQASPGSPKKTSSVQFPPGSQKDSDEEGDELDEGVNPKGLVSHAAEYFGRLRDGIDDKINSKPKESSSVQFSPGSPKNKSSVQFPPESPKESDEEDDELDEGSKEFINKMLGKRAQTRRQTVMGEAYNPEEDTEEDAKAIEAYPKTDVERKRILERSEDIFLFRVLDDSELNAVVDAMKPTAVKRGDVVITQGDDGDFFYLIDQGHFDIFIKDQQGEEQYIASYENKGYFGELALLHNQPRSATIKATSDGFLWAVSRKTFNRLVVRRAFEKRQAYMKLLDAVPELKPLSEYEKMQVADALRARVYNEGDVIVHEGDDGDGMYFIVEGKVSVKQKTDDGGEEELSQLGKEDFFGELALVKHQPRAATIVALETTKTAFLDVEAFERLLGPCIDIMERYARLKYE